MFIFRNILSIGMFAALFTLSPTVQSAILYNITEVGNFSNDLTNFYGRPFPLTQSSATAVNDNGQVAGTYDMPLARGAEVAYISTLKDLKTLDSYAGVRVFSSSYGNGLNNAGQLVGTYTTADFSTRAFVTVKGQRVDLGTLGGNYSAGYGINDAGQAVGEADNALFNRHAFKTVNGKMVDLGTLGGQDSIGYAINNHGEVAGSSATKEGHVHAFATIKGVMTDLGTLGGNYSNAYDINNHGQVVGSATLTDSDDSLIHAFVTVKGVMTDLGSLGGGSSVAYGINDAGQVVGEDKVTERAFVTLNGKMTDLNTLIDPSTGWMLSVATGINNYGQIVGTGINPKGATRAFLLSAVPVPSAVWLFGSALLGFGLSKRRKTVPVSH